mgnify:CR=1 FL=1
MNRSNIVFAILVVAGLAVVFGIGKSDNPPPAGDDIPALMTQSFVDLPRCYAEQLIDFRKRFEAGEVEDYAGELKEAIDIAKRDAFGELLAAVNAYERAGNDDDRRIELLRQLMKGSRDAAVRYRR